MKNSLQIIICLPFFHWSQNLFTNSCFIKIQPLTKFGKKAVNGGNIFWIVRTVFIFYMNSIQNKNLSSLKTVIIYSYKSFLTWIAFFFRFLEIQKVKINNRKTFLF